MLLNAIKIFLPTVLAFTVGIALTPRLTAWMYKNKMWKRQTRVTANDITNDDFKRIHDGKTETATPRLGGIIIWLSVLITIGLIWTISKVFPTELSSKFDFYSRSQTLVPLAALLFGAIVGLFDDYIQIRGTGKFAGDNISYRYVKIFLIIAVGLVIASWFYFKLGMTGVEVPFSPEKVWHLGPLFIPFFVVVLLATFSGGVIDGMDGLAGGVLAIIFASYSIIAFGRHQIDIAAFSGVISGAILSFLWFNIPPARFYMGETGIMGLLVVLTVIAFLTDTVLLLPIIALPLVVTSASAIIQIASYKYFGKRRVFKVAPIHHHFHALGWSREKVVMRYWVVSVVCALIGVVIALIGQ